MEIQEAKKLGIGAGITRIDFAFIMGRMRKFVQENQNHVRKALTEDTDRPDFYEGTGHFVSDYTLEVNNERIRAPKIVIASGSRPLVPPLKGIDTVEYLTNETVLQLDERPDSLIIIGGGYVAVEYAHFFAAMGTKVTIVEMADRLVRSEEPEISALLKDELSKRMEVHTGAQADEIRSDTGGITVTVSEGKTGLRRELAAQKVMIAAGRRSNADLLRVENTGVETDSRGYIRVDEYLETTRKDIFAVGDANGQQMFTHVANREAAIAEQNAFHGARLKMDYSAAPHAVFSHPQIASVGLTEEEARKSNNILVGKARYFDVAYGEAMMEERGFAKAVVNRDSSNILGFHVIGPHAPIIIQEVINAMAAGGHTNNLESGMHIHPALPELIMATLDDLQEK